MKFLESAPATQPSLNISVIYAEANLNPDTENFLRWLATAQSTGRIAYNCPKAPLHFVAEGAFLVSPAVLIKFSQFALPPDSAANWKDIQEQLFQTSLLHRFGKSRRRIHRLIYTAPSGKTSPLSGTIIKNCYVPTIFGFTPNISRWVTIPSPKLPANNHAGNRD